MTKIKIFGVEIPLDLSTFHFYGHVKHAECNEHDYNDRIQFSLPIGYKVTTGEVVEFLTRTMKKEITRKPSVHSYTQDYGDKREVISIDIPSGMRGIANPATFTFV